MNQITKINNTIQLLIRQGRKINQCIIELEQQRNDIISDPAKISQEIESYDHQKRLDIISII